MKSKNGLIEKQIFKNDNIEFDDEGFLITQSVLIPIKKRQQNMIYATILESRMNSRNSRNKNSVLR